MGISDALGTAAGQLIKILGKGTIEGVKIGYQIGKATGNVAKETVKGAAKGTAIVAKTIIGK